MNIDDYFGILPASIKETPTDRAGLFVRFSPSSNKWVVAYGVQRAKRYGKHKDQVGCGDTIIQAFEDLVVKIRDYSLNNKYEHAKRVDKTA